MVENFKIDLKNNKIICLEDLKEQMQENIYNKKHERIMDAIFLLFTDILLFWLLLSPMKSLIFLMLLEALFVVSKIWKTKNIVKGTKEAILYLEETILEEKQELENRKQQELEEIKDRRITEDKLELILNKAEFFFDYGLNYKK